MAPPTDAPDDLRLSAKAKRTQEQPISFLIDAAMRDPDLVSFAAGLVDPLTLPVVETLQITRALLSDDAGGREALQYGSTNGLARLRERCLSHIERVEGVSRESMSLTPDDLVVTTGSQQALYLIAETTCDPGDIVIAANPSYFVYTGTLQSFGARVLTVPMDGDGLRVDDLDRLLARIEADGDLPRVKFVYCTSYFQNPTGLTLSAGRRPKLLDVVRKYSKGHRILLVEDAAYRELGYDGDVPRAIKTYDADNGHVALSMTFSKPFAPGIKIGYVALPRGLAGPVLAQKGNHDFGSPNLCQQIADAALADGSYLAHLAPLRDGYRRKRDALLAALDEHLSGIEGLTWTRPGGGLYVWMTLPDGTDTSRGGATFDACLKAGVIYVPGAYCYQPDDAGRVPTNHLRLSFGLVPIEKIASGVERLAGVLWPLKCPLAPSRALGRGTPCPGDAVGRGAVAPTLDDPPCPARSSPISSATC